ncbi:MAG TPA: OmpW family outer membrane protein [Hyphomicrobiaceae bacterium]|jgi:outer membrane protein
MLDKRNSVVAITAAILAFSASGGAFAGDRYGNFMVRVEGRVVDPDSSADVFAAGVLQPTFDADISTAVVPTLTLTYFFTPNIALELLCCAAKFEAEGRKAINGVDLGDFWSIPPALTLQYHFDHWGGFKPYIGAGIHYMYFFNEGRSDFVAPLNGARLKLDDALGFTVQAGVDIEIANGWYLNADIKKTWIDTDASWEGTPVTAEVDIDPWIYTVGIGYRFNLEDIFGRRTAEYVPLK